MTFLDTSLLVALDLDEAGAPAASALLEGESRVALSALTRVEFLSAMARRRRGGLVDEPTAAAALERFRARWGQVEVVPLDESVLDRACDLAEQHALRTLDAIQLAGALAVAMRSPAPIRFGSLDARLNAAARAEGLEILAP